MNRRQRRRERERHDTYDYWCAEYVGHNGVPRGVDVYERRCVVCHPYTEDEVDALLGRQVNHQ